MYNLLRLPRLLAPALLLLAVSQPTQSQNIAPVAAKVIQARQNGALFRPTSLFTPLQISIEPEAKDFAPFAQFLALDPQALQSLRTEQPDAISIDIPYLGYAIHLDLVRVEILTPDFRLATSDGENGLNVFEPGLHYRGVVHGDNASIASFSVFSDGVMGLISDSRRTGNMVLGRMENGADDAPYILYGDELSYRYNPFNCATPELDMAPTGAEAAKAESVGGCVRMYLEANYYLLQQKGGVQQTVNYLTGVFNQMATLYANESVNLFLSQLFLWTAPDPYSMSNSASALTQFKQLRTNFNADVAHLVATSPNNLGGIAYVNTLCFNGANYAFSCIYTSYANVPTYSWTVEVLAHETGHVLGSNHTHWCGWPGGPIDNCFAPEGTCSSGPPPSNGGTIMSYCHLTPNGINFSNGFGPLPGNLIRSKVSQASCLSATCPQNNAGCTPPSALTVTNITISGASVGWTAVNGANSYELQYRAAGNSAWTSVPNPPNPCTLSGLVANQTYEVRIQSLCTSGNSGFLYGVLFKTGTSQNSGCSTPAGLSVQTTSSTTATAIWSAVSGATQYEIAWKPQSASIWGPAINTTATYYNMNGLTAGLAYQFRVKALCSATGSEYATATFTMPGNGTGGGSCGQPTNLAASEITNKSARITWNTTPGALSYDMQVRQQGALSWLTFTGLSSTNVRLLNLQNNKTYEVRVRAYCGAGSYSTYTPTLTFTTLSALPQESRSEMPDAAIQVEAPVFLHISPNPTTDVANVRLENAAPEQICTIFVYDAYGRMLRQTSAVSTTTSLDFRGFEPGMYFIRTDLPGVAVQRVIVE